MALLGLGFLSSFLLAGLSASLLILLWIISYHRGELLPICYDPTNWHSHEMLLVYAEAVIYSFLLTIVRNWINHPMPAGKSLVALVVLWLSGRIFPFFPQSIP